MAGLVDRLSEYITNKIICKDKKDMVCHFPKIPSPFEEDEIKKIEELTVKLEEKERQLYKKTALLEGILDTQYDCIVRTNKDGILTYCNDTYKKTFYNENLCKGICIYETVYPDHLDKVIKSHNKYFEPPYTSSIEVLLQTNKGYRWYHLHGKGIKNVNGNVTECQCVMRDIHEQKLNEEKIKLLMQKHDTLLNNVDALIWYVPEPDIQGPVNDAVVKFYNLPNKSAIEGKSLWDLMPVDEAKYCIESNRHVFETGKTVRTEEWVTDGNNERRLLAITKKPIKHEDRVKYVVSSAVDITEKHLTKEKLKDFYEIVEKRNVLLSAIIDCSGGYLWYKNNEGKYIFADVKFQHDFFKQVLSVEGYTDKELIKIFKEKTGKEHQFDNLCITTDKHSKDLKKVCKYIEVGMVDSNLVILEVTKTPVFDEMTGEYKGIIGFGLNKSEDYEQIINDIKYLLKKDKIEKLSENDYNNPPFVYYIKKDINIKQWMYCNL